MFTGIVESLGKVKEVKLNGGNLDVVVSSPFTSELKIDQSVAHNGVCLTVVSVNEDTYTVTAIQETLQKTNIGLLKKGDTVNLERCMPAHGRFDGHIVQGHVDQVAICKTIEHLEGSWKYTFQYEPATGNVTVEKGSICVNGVSLTVVDSKTGEFSVCIIPYTFQNTNFQFFKLGDCINLEFDIIGKYVSRLVPKINLG